MSYVRRYAPSFFIITVFFIRNYSYCWFMCISFLKDLQDCSEKRCIFVF